ncbi:MAG: hypothetical protein B6U76_00860 [Desulfurococcales archaeon ex4484_217_2]|nr:MAG: hypothetical protein B6U76_00860 [Desulfurococcales archaeon ex4484_217_2]
MSRFLSLRINEGRVGVVGEVIGDIGWEGFLRFDMREPEFRVLSEIYRRVGDSRVVVVLGLAAGIVDFQLGPGGAPRFWNTLLQTVSRRGFKLGSLNDVREAVFDFLKEPINARFRKTKYSRIEKFFSSDFAQYLWSKGLDYLAENPKEVWYRLAGALNNRPQQKTIVFAMKVLDLITLIVKGHYAKFPPNVSIPLDMHVARMALTSGIVEYHWTGKLASTIVEELMSRNPQVFRSAWAEVSRHVSEKIGKHISLLRLDSLVWQIGRKAYETHYIRTLAKQKIKRYLIEEVKIDPQIAEKIADTFTYRM